MTNIQNQKHPAVNSIEIDIFQIFKILWNKKFFICCMTFVFTTISIVITLNMPNIYKSDALLNSTNASSNMQSSYSSLANLAGITIPQNTESNTSKAIVKLNSLSFFENNILPNIYLPNLMAVHSWDSKTNTLILDAKLYDKTSEKWVRDFSYPSSPIPSAQEAFKTFKDEHLSIKENKQTGFITLSVKHQSPHIAQKWTELIVDQVNFFYRNKDKVEAEKAVNYLNEQIINTKYSEIKEVMAELLKQEIQKLTLIEANNAYVFEYLDPPVVMENKSEPARAFIVVLSAFIALMISIFLTLINFFFKK